jgi:SPX domain protein involved in polyphosphate accumulation
VPLCCNPNSCADPAQRAAFWARGGRAPAGQREALRAQLEELYATASNLQNYVKANRTGFRKILKKHDKLTSVRLQAVLGVII